MVGIKEISAEQTYKIRKEVLRKNSKLPVQFNGDFDVDTFHLGVFEEDGLKGIASFMKTTDVEFDVDQYQLRGMAVLLESRGKGYAKLLMKEAFVELKKRKISMLWCNAREVALKFYLKIGFSQMGNPFEIQQIGVHYKLFKKITF